MTVPEEKTMTSIATIQRTGCFLGLWLMALPPVGALAAIPLPDSDPPDPVAACDTLAGSPERMPGVVWDRLDAGQAVPVCQQALEIEPDNPRLQFQLGRALHKAGQYQTAMAWYQRAADAGWAAALNNIGALYYFGEGVAVDHGEAVRWFRRAAEQGSLMAAHNLGKSYDDGEGVTVDHAKAAHWFRQAAEGGYPAAQNDLATLYEAGEGVPRDLAAAREWYRKAAENGDATGAYNLGRFFLHGIGIDPDHGMALDWFQRAARGGDGAALATLGSIYLNGQGIEADPAQAARWYEQAARKGRADAQYSLGWQYLKGRGVTEDHGQARHWFEQAAAQGYMEARYALWTMYHQSQGYTEGDTAPPRVARLTLTMECGSGDAVERRSQHLYLEELRDDIAPLVAEKARLQGEGCRLSAEVEASLLRMAEIAREHGVSFPELVVEALRNCGSGDGEKRQMVGRDKFYLI